MAEDCPHESAGRTRKESCSLSRSRNYASSGPATPPNKARNIASRWPPPTGPKICSSAIRRCSSRSTRTPGPRARSKRATCARSWSGLASRRAVESSMRRAASGGILVIYIVNRDFVVRHFDPQGYEAFGDIVHIEQRHLDLVTSRMRNEWRFFRRNGEDLDHILTVPIEHCIYSLHELRRLLVRGGWHPTEAFGGFKMDAPSIDNPTQVVVGRR